MENVDFKIFSTIDIKSLTEEEAREELLKYLELARSKKTKYSPVGRVVSLIEDQEEAKKVCFSVLEFNKEFDKISREADKLLTEGNNSLALEKVREYDVLFNSTEPIYQKYKSLFISSIHENFEHGEGSQIHKREIDRLNSAWSTLQSNLSNKIDEGIRSVLELKRVLGVTGAFKDQIEDEITKNRKAAKLNFTLFVLTLLCIPILIAGTYFTNMMCQLGWSEKALLRLTIALPLLWIATWFSRNYAYSKLATLKFDHLNRLLGEGMPTIAKLVESDPKAKSEVYNKFVELILDIKDITNIVDKQPKPPSEGLLKELLKKGQS